MTKKLEFNVLWFFRWIKNLILGEPTNPKPAEFALISSDRSGEFLYGGTCEPTRLTACHYLKISPVPRAIASNLIPKEGWYQIRFF